MDDATRADLEGFLDAMYVWNERKNLTRVPREEAWARHIEDSLALLPYCADGAAVLDIGTGPGLPAWPLARVRPDLTVAALDSNGKMLDFLRSAPLPNLVVAQGRAEEVDLGGRADLVTGRAVAPLAMQLELSAGHVRKNGFVVPLRTVADEGLIPAIDLAPIGLEYRGGQTVEIGGVARFIPVFVRTGFLRRGYPRRWPEIRAKPL